VITDELRHVPIDYWAMREGIKAAIESYPPLDVLRGHVFLEFSGEPSPEILPCVMVFMTGRETIPTEQRIGAGMRTDHRLVFSVWVLAYSPESMAVAVKDRDALLAKVELALMVDRTLGGLLKRSLVLSAGMVENGQDSKKGVFATAIETQVQCDVFTTI
jgi:hypothetical protein